MLGLESSADLSHLLNSCAVSVRIACLASQLGLEGHQGNLVLFITLTLCSFVRLYHFLLLLLMLIFELGNDELAEFILVSIESHFALW